MGISLIVKEFLPLPDHAQVTVVKHRYFDRQFVDDSCGEFLDVHLY